MIDLTSFVEPACSDDQDGLGRTALTYAVHYQQMSALHCLLENEANPNVTAHGKPLILCILMDSALWFDTINLG